MINYIRAPSNKINTDSMHRQSAFYVASAFCENFGQLLSLLQNRKTIKKKSCLGGYDIAFFFFKKNKSVIINNSFLLLVAKQSSVIFL
jgi:hypothetical protein